MKNERRHSLQVVITSGPEALGRAILGFAFAVSAAASGVKVMVVLALNGTAWARDNEPAAKQTLNGFESVGNYMKILEENGATVSLCSTCAGNGCNHTCNTNADRNSYVGLTELAIRAASGRAQTVIF
jgi:predicted peroxiredoxin